MTRQYGRYGYRRIAALLREAGWSVSDGRVGRLWRREGLKVPTKQPKKSRLWLNDGSCVRLRSEHQDHVWNYDFVHCRLPDSPLFLARYDGGRMAWTAAAHGDYVRDVGAYASGVTDREWLLFEAHLQPAKPGGRPRTTCLRRV